MDMWNSKFGGRFMMFYLGNCFLFLSRYLRKTVLLFVVPMIDRKVGDVSCRLTVLFPQVVA